MAQTTARGGGWRVKPMDLILGQWQVNGIVTVGVSTPLQIAVSQNTSNSFGGGQRPRPDGQCLAGALLRLRQSAPGFRITQDGEMTSRCRIGATGVRR